ncbi:retrotransposon protein, putative, ty1-copia subclass [Tanacetum coccineum]
MAASGKSNRKSKKKAEYEIAPTSDPKEAVCFYCNTKGLKESRRLKHRELNLVKGNKKITLVTKIGNHNGNVILNVGLSNELDKSKLWHSRLGHINKKHIVQLQKDGVLESFDFKLDDVYESCLLGKITKSPFTGSCEKCWQGLLDYDIGRLQESGDDIPIVNTELFNQEVVDTSLSLNVISVPIALDTSVRGRSLLSFYSGFHIEVDKISDKYTK